MTEIIKHLFLKHNNIHHNFYIFRHHLNFPLIIFNCTQSESIIEQRNERWREYIDIEGLDNAIVEKWWKKWSKWPRYLVVHQLQPFDWSAENGLPHKNDPLGPRQDWFSELMTRRAILPHENQGEGFDGPSLRSQRYFFTWEPGLRRHLVRFCFTKKSSRPLSNTEPSATCACGNFSPSPSSFTLQDDCLLESFSGV